MDIAALNFTGKTVWVTGAHQGIGREIAVSFARLGAQVVGFDKKFSGDEAGAQFREIHLDLSDRAQVESTMAKMLATKPCIDVLVNAAGILHIGSVESLTSEAWQELFAVNVTGVFLILKHLVPVFKAQRHGAIVNIGSNAAHAPRNHMAGYGASKAALASLTQSVALDLAPYGVRCNLIAPGSTDTPMQRSMWQSEDDRAKVISGSPDQYRLGIPLGKLAQSSDIANLAVFLASDLAGHIIMQNIVVDGGATLGA